MRNLGFWRSFEGSLSLHTVLGAGSEHFGIFEGFSRVYLALCSPRSGLHTFWNFWRGFLGSFLLYVILRAGRAQFGIFGGVSRVYFTLHSPWNFWGSF